MPVADRGRKVGSRKLRFLEIPSRPGRAQTADVHGREPRPAVELPIIRNNALVPRPGSSSTHFPCRRNLGVGRTSIYTAALSGFWLPPRLGSTLQRRASIGGGASVCPASSVESVPVCLASV